MTDHDLISNIHHRMDLQDDLLREIRDKVISQETMKPAHWRTLVALWKGSKIMIPMIGQCCGRNAVGGSGHGRRIISNDYRP
jgi:hypothetical protein